MLDPRLNMERLGARPPGAYPIEALLDGRSDPGDGPALGRAGELADDRTGETLSVRMSIPEDRLILVRLAALDSASLPPAPLLVGELEGSIAAAVSLASGETIADPFRPTLQLVELLHLRARQLKQGQDDGKDPHGPAQLPAWPWHWRRLARRRRVPALS